MSMADQLAPFLRALSRLCGWIYTLSWSLSFYPQPLLNWTRKSTSGTTVDYPFLNVVGFTCYTVSTSTLLYSPVIRAQYALRHPHAPLPTTQLNDEVFGLHALLLVLITYSQFYSTLWGFEECRQPRISRAVAVITGCCAVAVTVVVCLVVVENGLTEQTDPSKWMWIDLVNTIGYVKLAVTVAKYVPQAWLNYTRKSTTGWSIGQVFLDLLGGVLSMVQLAIDASLQNSWRDVINNPVKLGLANVSSSFDVLFILQHYVVYTGTTAKKSAEGEGNGVAEEPLLQEHTSRVERDL